jgi:diguanylate cyclase (GGDEF)-like protein/PAS domain S-box-containing protein
MEQNLGYPAERLAKMGLLDLVSESDAARMSQAVEQADNGHAVTLEVHLRTVSGEQVPYLVSTTVINPIHGGGVAVVGVGFDISDRKALEMELQRQASVDYLTGAYNRRKFMELLDGECARARRYDRRLAMIMFDIDHFKLVNDTHGHDIGDQVLREVVRRALGCLRQSDVLARWGGEEFAVLVPESRVDQAAQLAEKIRIDLHHVPIAVAGTIMASFGVAEYQPTETLEGFIKRADSALYRAKNAGRNRVESDF